MKGTRRKIHVLRIGHRLVRDDRVSTHVGLVARAFGANKIYLVRADEGIKQSINDVATRWGGAFTAEVTEEWRPIVRRWRADGGVIVHLTMYGEPANDVLPLLRGTDRNLLVVVGAEKVPSELYRLSDFNVSVSNQPHSEIAALAVFLDRFFEGEELKQRFRNHRIMVLPSKRGKKVEMSD